MAFQIPVPPDEPRTVSQSVLQVLDFLGLYQAELARILGLQCGAIGRLAAGQWCLQENTPAWDAAKGLIALYQELFTRCAGDPVAMVHWLRVPIAAFDATPHRLLVDEGRLAELLDWLVAQPPGTR